MLFKRKIASMFLYGMFVMGGMVSVQQQMMHQQQQQKQKDYSAEEIDRFAEAVLEVLPIQQKAEQKMVKEIEEQGMDRFNQIARQMQQGKEPEGVQEEDMQIFQSISDEIHSVQMEAQQEVSQVVSEAGIGPDMYQEMIAAYSSNPEIKQRVD
ncbi:DUF4168 domain-containing protein [Marinilabilia sp.]|uniref:DUF4168 domain-containing protein n=1 Tax=Marinilabilia sp. TaxID=2021252 RepID=UPI0025BF539B|nr:DUF4168 domain-containing protein [Marinilabilia sp.]